LQLNLAESYRNQRRYDNALTILEKLIDKAILAEDYEIVIKAKANKGLNLISIGSFEKAMRFLREVISISNRFEICLEERAMLYIIGAG